MKWTEIKITAAKVDEEVLTAILLDFSAQGVFVEDYSDLKEDHVAGKWDYIDEELAKQDKEHIKMHIYLEEDMGVLSTLCEIKERLKSAKNDGLLGEISFDILSAEESDWENGWKKYYKPTLIGEKIVVKPSWEDYKAEPDKVVITLDPSSAFGTGTHETTRMCMLSLEKYVAEGQSVLDLGTGSGILAVAAALLGASKVDAVDIDANAVRVANLNAERNEVLEKINAYRGDLFELVDDSYDIIAANIVADVIVDIMLRIPYYLKPDGKFIASGIIVERAGDVEQAAEAAGLKIISKLEDGEWNAYVMEV